MAAIADFLASHHGLITEGQHYDDPVWNRSFMRAVFQDNGCGLPPPAELGARFAGTVARHFGMAWSLHEASSPCRTVLAVSRQGHCLNSTLHRWSNGTLPIEVLAVVSNHQDPRSLAEWHGVPFHFFPISEGRKRDQELRISELFARLDAELLVLARYMHILTPDACADFAGRAINIHHSFLPGFEGSHAYHQAHQRGVKLVGAIAQHVTNDLDEGPIIEQEVERGDHTVSAEDPAATGSELERVVLNRAINWHAERRVFRNRGLTVILR